MTETHGMQRVSATGITNGNMLYGGFFFVRRLQHHFYRALY